MLPLPGVLLAHCSGVGRWGTSLHLSVAPSITDHLSMIHAPSSNLSSYRSVIMQQWMAEERTFAVKAYYQNGESLVRARRAFRTHFNVPRSRPVPSNHAMKTWVANFEVSGSTSKKRGGSLKTVRTPENIERVRVAFERSPRRSAVRHAATLGITPRSVQRILHNDLHTTRTRSRSFRL